MRNLIFFPIFVLLMAVSAQVTIANVLIEDTEANSIVDDGGFGDGTLATGSGQASNYVIFTCSAPNDIGNVFNNPTPGTWTQLDEGACGNDGRLCRHGIWGGFVDNPNSESINCSWTEFGTVFTATSMRFSNVDQFTPIGEVACDSGILAADAELDAPEVFAEAGSQVIGVITISSLTNTNPITTTTNTDENPFISTRGEPSAFVGANAISLSQNIETLEVSAITPVDATISPFKVQNGSNPWEYRICSIVVRMGSVNVPTMSEWGLISFAAFAGIAGFWFIRRRQLAA